jgi:hypothetical protein
MMTRSKLFELLFEALLSERTKKAFEKIIIQIAIVSFIVHLFAIALAKVNIIEVNSSSELLNHPIAAIYTPFSFILLYEVYLLVYYLPKSISNYVTKQYEIITLIVIRRIFKDLANLELTTEWFQRKYDLQFTYDIVSTVILFFLLYLFQRMISMGHIADAPVKLSKKINRFIQRKKLLSLFLVPVFLFLAIYSLGGWLYFSIVGDDQVIKSITSINSIFFNEFFTVLILTDDLVVGLCSLHRKQ